MNEYNITHEGEFFESLRKRLAELSSKESRDSIQRFHRNPLRMYGVMTPDVNRVAKEWFRKIERTNKEEVFARCELLWQSGFIEESLIACSWSEAMHKQYTPDDYELFIRWIELYIDNWATCDTFCNRTMGKLLTLYPFLISRLPALTSSSNRWVRRAAPDSLIPLARQGEHLETVLDLASRLMIDTDDMVQKGYGWTLKEASRKHPQEIFDFVKRHRHIMPRTAYRYAIELLPADLRIEAMQK